MTGDTIDVIPHADKILLSDIILIYKSKESIRQSYISIVLLLKVNKYASLISNCLVLT